MRCFRGHEDSEGIRAVRCRERIGLPKSTLVHGMWRLVRNPACKEEEDAHRKRWSRPGFMLLIADGPYAAQSNTPLRLAFGVLVVFIVVVITTLRILTEKCKAISLLKRDIRTCMPQDRLSMIASPGHIHGMVSGAAESSSPTTTAGRDLVDLQSSRLSRKETPIATSIQGYSHGNGSGWPKNQDPRPIRKSRPGRRLRTRRLRLGLTNQGCSSGGC